jgi:protein-tyrosine-phosphatase
LTQINKSFCIVCFANYCRSPVVENLLNKRFKNNYEFFSAGISPLSQPSMDPRSLKFLKENNVYHSFHNPKKINNQMLNYFDKFLAVDFYILNLLNKNYPKYKHKFFSLTMQSKDINIIDPYMFEDDEYFKTMNNIKSVVEKINLEEI